MWIWTHQPLIKLTLKQPPDLKSHRRHIINHEWIDDISMSNVAPTFVKQHQNNVKIKLSTYQPTYFQPMWPRWVFTNVFLNWFLVAVECDEQLLQRWGRCWNFLGVPRIERWDEVGLGGGYTYTSQVSLGMFCDFIISCATAHNRSSVSMFVLFFSWLIETLFFRGESG